jgi:hypothetical protein
MPTLAGQDDPSHRCSSKSSVAKSSAAVCQLSIACRHCAVALLVKKILKILTENGKKILLEEDIVTEENIDIEVFSLWS